MNSYLSQLKFLDQLDDLDHEFFTENYSRPITSSSAGNSTNNDSKIGDVSASGPANSVSVSPSKSSKDVQNHLESMSASEFHSKFGFSKESVQAIYQMIEYGFKQDTRRGNPKSPMYSLLLTLQFLTTGSMENLHTDNDSESASQSTICRILKRVTALLAELKPRFVKIPDANRIKTIAEKFDRIGGFPGVFACVGSTHIAIKTPVKSVAEDYLNENGYYSYRLFACVGPDLEFFETISRWPGASHENKIFNLSEMFQRFEFTTKMDGVLLANERYSCTNCVMTPIDASMDFGCEKNLRYNLAHQRTYNFPEAISLLKRRFRCLTNVLAFQDETVQSIITACVVLHNFAIQRKEPKPTEDNFAEIRQVKQVNCIERRLLPRAPISADPRGIFKRNEIIATHFDSG